MSSWYQNYDITWVRFLLGHSDKCLPHNHEVTVLSQYYVTSTRDDNIIMRSQCCHGTMPTLWGHYDVLMISKLWHRMCEMFVRSQCQKFTTSLWGHSVVIVWCHRDTRWLHHHEVTVSSQCDVADARDDHITMRSQCCHSMMFTMWGNYGVSMISELWHHMCDLCVRSLWYEFTTSPWGHSVVTVWCHRYMRWLHHHEVTLLSQCDVTDTRDDHITMRSQCCHRTMLTMWDHYDIGIMTSPVLYFWRSQWYKLSTSRGHSVVTVWCHMYSRWPHQHEVTVLSHDDADEVTMSSSWY